MDKFMFPSYNERGIGERVDYLVDEYDKVIERLEEANYYKAQCDALTRENAQLRAQLEERNKEFEEMYESMKVLSDAYKSMRDHIHKVEEIKLKK